MEFFGCDSFRDETYGDVKTSEITYGDVSYGDKMYGDISYGTNFPVQLSLLGIQRAIFARF